MTRRDWSPGMEQVNKDGQWCLNPGLGCCLSATSRQELSTKTTGTVNMPHIEEMPYFEDLYAWMAHLPITTQKTKITDYFSQNTTSFCLLDSEEETLLVLPSNINSELPRHISYWDALVFLWVIPSGINENRLYKSPCTRLRTSSHNHDRGFRADDTQFLSLPITAQLIFWSPLYPPALCCSIS